MMNDPHLSLLEDCLLGKTKALEELIQFFQPKVFSLALKFLWNPEDAEDATQEILVKVITNLGGFRRESKLSTWIYQIASNHLINAKKSKLETKRIHLRTIRDELHRSQSPSASVVPFDPDSQDKEDETKEKISHLVLHVQVACTYAMLQSMTRKYRMAYLLGEVFTFSSEEAGYVMGIRADAFRQILKRARNQMEEFLGKECSLTNVNNHCHCQNRIRYASKAGRIQSYLNLSEQMKRDGRWEKMKPLLPETKKLRKAAEVFRNQPNLLPKKNQLDGIRVLLNHSLPFTTR
ncbi:RNA polymerase sigma factor [Leptospira yanagawae]|uniref:RNA polymerase sigma factor n=1 Tax=Leptospira yanagawae TaxID=293069 RepID=A0ABY2LZ68_9LEPT|nr:RNA polymerase sigma factor [Leptospira yanagawae]TGL17518.1 RNA polymerase sigma factor [Leptospira yanagawae]